MSEKLKRFISNNKQLLIMLGAIAVVFIILALTVPSFATVRNLTQMLYACRRENVVTVPGKDEENMVIQRIVLLQIR